MHMTGEVADNGSSHPGLTTPLMNAYVEGPIITAYNILHDMQCIHGVLCHACMMTS